MSDPAQTPNFAPLQTEADQHQPLEPNMGAAPGQPLGQAPHMPDAQMQYAEAPPIYAEHPAEGMAQPVADPYQQQAVHGQPAGTQFYTADPSFTPEPPPVQQQAYAESAAAGYSSLGNEDMSDIRPVPRVSIHAFCETDGIRNILTNAANDRRMAKAHIDINNGGIAAAAANYATTTTPNLILVETRRSGMEIIEELQTLAEVCDEGTNVVVIGHQNDVQLYRELMSRGVAEYLVAPVSMGEVMNVVNELFVNPEAEPLGSSIAFLGSRGGAGSSTVAHNIAWAISDGFHSDVILADFDLAFGTANIDFDKDPPQGVAEAVFSADRMDDTFLDRLLDKCSDHLSLLAAPSTLDREYDFAPDDFHQLIEVAQRGTPNVIVDLPHLWTGWMKNVLLSVDKIVITATPDLASLRNTKNLVDLLAEARPNDDKPFLVLNQCNIPKKPEISIDDFSDPLGVEPTIVLPFEPALFGQAANNGQMISEADPKHEIAAAFEQLAQVLTGRRELPSADTAKKKSLLGFLKR